MNFNLLEEKLLDYGTGGYYLIESFLLELLRLEANSSGRKLITGERNSRSRFDAYAPNGLSEINKPLAIEIVHSISPKKIDSIVSWYKKLSNSEDESLLIISMRDIKNYSFFEELGIGLNEQIIFWGKNEIQSLIDKHSDEASKLVNTLFSIRFKQAISRSSEDWKEQRKEVIKEISYHYKSGRFSMMLGAGVSSSAGLPDWDTLLNSLFVSMLTDDGLNTKKTENDQISSIVRRLREIDGPSSLMLARYLRKGLSSGSSEEQSKFIESVTSQLYQLRDKRFSLNSPLIKSIASLCTPSRTGARVRSVLTYNFDDLLERELQDRGLSFKSIFEEIDLAGPEELPVYHVHGFLPEDRSNYPNIEQSTLVFSEEGYHQIYGEAYHWSNLIQLNSLKETACLMVGLSLTDPNLRRLLEISAKSLDKPKHFAFLKRISFEEFSKEEGKTVVKTSANTTRKFLERHHSLNEEVMRELGVNIIWYENYDEIPKIIKEIERSI
ncbi:SIR2 family protein [Pseudoalteromonas sp. McH1-42]|uniref:SIR2 family protein n=1 Tax=Pseudoalteromonas sp. McH1-42 TaxID=2917752 RepID=UPI001EF482FB|nr:SIR2 family protein [Pseudoalteromonas sp. McH1-42]MCG7560855.1 SIR2 family protein [Pseudoalteromonas sp. McH1-42]